MARFWSGQIGAIELLDLDGAVAGFDLIGAGAFVSNWTGNTRPGMLGNPHTQYAQVNYNKPLDLEFLHCPQTLAENLLELFIPLIPSGSGVVCSFTDGFQTINGTFKPNVPDWYKRGLPDGDYLNDFVLRLINRAAMS